VRPAQGTGDGVLIGHLRAFVEIAHQQNFTHAAQALLLTQPALTSRIRRLEHEVGATLFVRDRRGARLTDAGRALLPYAEQTVATMTKAESALRLALSGMTGELVIGAVSTIATYLLPPAIRVFRAANPNVHTSLRTALSEDVLDMVARGTVHLGLGRLLQHPDIETTPLYEEEWILAVDRRHRFASASRLSAADLVGETFITVQRSRSYQDFMQMLFRRANAVPPSTIDVDSAEAGKKMISESLGVGLAPRMAVADGLAAGEFHRLVIDGLPPMKLTMAAMLLRQSAEMSSVRELLRLIRERLGAMGYATITKSGSRRSKHGGAG
jgi:DNA-binding transcriptional LysR family regulator